MRCGRDSDMLVLDDSRDAAAEAAPIRSPSIAGLPQPRIRFYVFSKSAGKQNVVPTEPSNCFPDAADA